MEDKQSWYCKLFVKENANKLLYLKKNTNKYCFLTQQLKGHDHNTLFWLFNLHLILVKRPRAIEHQILNF